MVKVVLEVFKPAESVSGLSFVSKIGCRDMTCVGLWLSTTVLILTRKNGKGSSRPDLFLSHGFSEECTNGIGIPIFLQNLTPWSHPL
jgi:hypothetical protein